MVTHTWKRRNSGIFADLKDTTSFLIAQPQKEGELVLKTLKKKCSASSTTLGGADYGAVSFLNFNIRTPFHTANPRLAGRVCADS